MPIRDSQNKHQHVRFRVQRFGNTAAFAAFLLIEANIPVYSCLLRPTLMGAFGILFCNDFKRLFYFFFHTAVCCGPVHHGEKGKSKNSFEIVPK